MQEITLRFKTSDPEIAQGLLHCWLSDEPITVRTPEGQDQIRLTFVKTQEME